MYKNLLPSILLGYIASITLGICPLQLSEKDGMAGMNHGAAYTETSMYTIVLKDSHQPRSPSCENCLGTSTNEANNHSGITSSKQATANDYAIHVPVACTQPLLISLVNISPDHRVERPPPNGPAMVGVVILRT